MVKKSKINEIKMEVQGRIIPVQVIRSDRKSIGLEIRQDTSVIARVPYRLSDKGLETIFTAYGKGAGTDKGENSRTGKILL